MIRISDKSKKTDKSPRMMADRKLEFQDAFSLVKLEPGVKEEKKEDSRFNKLELVQDHKATGYTNYPVQRGFGTYSPVQELNRRYSGNNSPSVQSTGVQNYNQFYQNNHSDQGFRSYVPPEQPQNGFRSYSPENRFYPPERKSFSPEHQFYSPDHSPRQKSYSPENPCYQVPEMYYNTARDFNYVYNGEMMQDRYSLIEYDPPIPHPVHPKPVYQPQYVHNFWQQQQQHHHQSFTGGIFFN